MHLKTNQIFALNATGARFWELFAAGGTRPEIEATMLAEFDVEPRRARAPRSTALLAALAREDIVRSLSPR